MKISFKPKAWEHFEYWLENDKKTLNKIKEIIKDVKRSPYDGIGKPEPLKYNLTGAWSRRIDRFNRFVYIVKDNEIIVLSCRYHYD